MTWKLKCLVTPANVPFERTVSFTDANEVEQELQTDAGNLESEASGDGRLTVYPVERRGDQFLVALPVETSSGQRRVWVRKCQLTAEGATHDPVRS